ncbi:MAG: TetR/AcrR family transcriptional regulator [Christensenellales bacterium]|jgi:AcrR family transcriptional regulator
MREVKVSRKTRYTKKALQDSLIELMKEKPISKITIKELCETADINRTTFYTHYASQYDLLRAIERETLDWAEEAISAFFTKTDKGEVRALIQSILQYIIENSGHLQVLMSERGDIGFQKQLFTSIYKKCGITGQNGGDDTAKECLFVFVVTGSIGLIQHWLKNGLKEPAEQIAEIIYNIAATVT